MMKYEKSKANILLFIFLGVILLPQTVMAKEIDTKKMKAGDIIQFGDRLNLGPDRTFGCGGGQKCPTTEEIALWIDKIIFDDGKEMGLYEGKRDWDTAPIRLGKKGALFYLPVEENGNYYVDISDNFKRQFFQRDIFYLSSEDISDQDISALDKEESDRYLQILNERFDDMKLTFREVKHSERGTIIDAVSHLFFEASFQSKEIQVEYYNTKEVQNTNPVTYQEKDGVVTLKSLTKDGYSFQGWYLSEDYKTEIKEIDNDIFQKVLDENDGVLKIYAKWEESKNVVSIENPNTMTTVIYVIVIVGIVGVIGAIIILNKKRK